MSAPDVDLIAALYLLQHQPQLMEPLARLAREQPARLGVHPPVSAIVFLPGSARPLQAQLLARRGRPPDMQKCEG